MREPDKGHLPKPYRKRPAYWPDVTCRDTARRPCSATFFSVRTGSPSHYDKTRKEKGRRNRNEKKFIFFFFSPETHMVVILENPR